MPLGLWRVCERALSHLAAPCWHDYACPVSPVFLLLTTRKMATNTIQYTGEQARDFAGVSPEAWRHWRKVVPWLSNKKGKKARFSAGELVALAVVGSVTTTLYVGVSGLAPQWNELFSFCAPQRPGSLRSAFAVITADSIRLVGAEGIECGVPAIVVPCEPIVDRLWAAAFSGNVEQQQVPLPFAPQAVRGAAH